MSKGLAGPDLDRHAVAQQLVHRLVVAVQVAAVLVGLAVQGAERAANLPRVITTVHQKSREQAVFDIAVACALGPVAQVAVAQLILKQDDHAVLRGPLGLADGAHGTLSPLCG